MPMNNLSSFSDMESENYVLRLILTILGPIIGLGIAIGGVVFYIFVRRTKRKRPPTIRRNKLLIDPEIEPSILHFSSPSNSATTYHPHELRATAAGDSTLKVKSLYTKILSGISLNFLN